LATWKKIACIYSPKPLPALLSCSLFPQAVLQAGCLWYGQVLGRFVHILARIFVSKLTYLADSNPTLSGPELNVTIIPDCSDQRGELFDYLFGAVAFLDWNRFRKAELCWFISPACWPLLLGNAIESPLLLRLAITASQKASRDSIFPQLDLFLCRFFSSIVDDVPLDADRES